MELADEGVFLAQPAVDAPTVEECTVAGGGIAQPEPAVAVKAKLVRKYPTSSPKFKGPS